MDELGISSSRAVALLGRLKYGQGKALARLAREAAIEEIQRRLDAQSADGDGRKSLLLSRSSYDEIEAADFAITFLAPAQIRGSPRIFISHGTEDRVLPIEVTSHDIVPRLRDHGYDVRLVQFEGRHEVPSDVARRAIDWFLHSSA